MTKPAPVTPVALKGTGVTGTVILHPLDKPSRVTVAWADGQVTDCKAALLEEVDR
jgi:hypothetical protein